MCLPGSIKNQTLHLNTNDTLNCLLRNGWLFLESGFGLRNSLSSELLKVAKITTNDELLNSIIDSF